MFLWLYYRFSHHSALIEKSRSSLTETIHFGNDQRPASLRSDYWMLSLGSPDALRRYPCRV